MPDKRVAVAMSGGVDSSTSAAILKEKGYEVCGVTMQLSDGSSDAIESARNVASILNIPHHVIDFREVFARRIISPFCEEYSRGRTPNPCVFCNQYIKFGALLDKVREMGADYLATGHYARIEQMNGRYKLLKGVDQGKDQSYFLYRLGQRELKYLIFPVGSMRKTEVKKLATELGLPTATRKESQDICFIPDNDSRSFLKQHIALQPGDIVDTSEKVLGKHDGLALYTVGQRQGLRVSSKSRLYVLKLDAVSNRVVVGAEEQLLQDRLIAGNLNWISGTVPESPIEVTARVRYRASEAVAIVYLKNGVAEVHFREPQRAIAPGQSVVFYQGDEVLGGGIIADIL